MSRVSITESRSSALIVCAKPTAADFSASLSRVAVPIEAIMTFAALTFR
jgi:hypothetical protein